MGTELRVTLPGPEGSADADRALNVLRRILQLLNHLEDGAVDERTRLGQVTRWGFTHIGLGSMTSTLAPNRPRPGVSTATLTEVTARAVDGFAEAEEHDGIPEHWNRGAAATGAELAQLLGLLPSDGLTLEHLLNGMVLRRAVVTRRAEEHLRAGLKQVDQHRAIGSVIGRLETAIHDRREARLQLERTGERVRVYFTPEQVETVRGAWGRRVEIAGRLARDVDGRVLSIRMRSLHPLPEAAESPPVTGLVGLDPNFTGDVDPGDYLGMIRGAS